MKRLLAFTFFLLFLAGLALVNLVFMKPVSGTTTSDGALHGRLAGSDSQTVADMGSAGSALPADRIRLLTVQHTQPALALFHLQAVGQPVDPSRLPE